MITINEVLSFMEKSDTMHSVAYMASHMKGNELELLMRKIKRDEMNEFAEWSIAKNPYSTKSMLDMICVDDRYIRISEALVYNKKISNNIMEKISNSDYTEIRKYVYLVKNGNYIPEHNEWTMIDSFPEVEYGVPSGTNVSFECVLEYLLHENNCYSRAFLASHHETPKHVLIELFKYKEFGTLQGLAKNEKTPDTILLDLCEWCMENLEKYTCEDPSICNCASERSVMFSHLARNSNIPKTVMSMLANEENMSTLIQLAKHPNVTEDILVSIINSASGELGPDAILWACKNNNLSTVMIEEMIEEMLDEECDEECDLDYFMGCAYETRTLNNKIVKKMIGRDKFILDKTIASNHKLTQEIVHKLLKKSCDKKDTIKLINENPSYTEEIANIILVYKELNC
jgi:hypothetical protein